MTAPVAFLGRLQSRWRKWARDPAGFVDELPSPWLRAVLAFELAGFTWAADWLDLKSRRAAAAWRSAGVSLRRTVGGGHAGDYAFLDWAGGAPGVWPEHVRLEPSAARAMAVAFGEGGELSAVAEIGPDGPGVLALSGQPARVRVYRLSEGADLPDEIGTVPLGRDGLVRLSRESGASLMDSLKRAWPPSDRRASEPSASAYRAWIARNEPSPAELAAMAAQLARRSDLPLISVLMPVHDPRPEHLRAAIASVRAQTYGGWRLCICDDGSLSEPVRTILAETARDGRVRLITHGSAHGVAAATNAALALAEGEIAVFLDHDDELAPHALATVALAFAQTPGLAAAYSDEDTIDAHGRRSAPLFKPEFDRRRLLAQNYVNHLFSIRLDLLRRLGGVREGFEGAQDHDLVLRAAAAGEDEIRRLPQVLYHWRSYPGGRSFSQRSRAVAEASRLRAVEDHLRATGRAADVVIGPRGRLVVEPKLPAQPLKVLAVVPTRDRPGLLEACMAGLLEQTDYPGLEVCIVDNGGIEPAAQALLCRLAADPRVRVMRIEGPFNFSSLNNAAARTGDAPVLAFLNDDVMVVEPDWLSRMVALALEPDVGAVGAKLFYPDGRLQHAGIVLGLGPQGVAGHEFRGAPGDSPGPQDRLLVAREVSAVTAACLVVERRKFDAAGGFDEAALPVAFNDVDLCLRLSQQGWRTLWTPRARLLHLESATRGSDRSGAAGERFAAEAARMRERWGPLLRADPYYNPNLTLADEGFGLAPRSRDKPPRLR